MEKYICNLTVFLLIVSLTLQTLRIKVTRYVNQKRYVSDKQIHTSYPISSQRMYNNNHNKQYWI